MSATLPAGVQTAERAATAAERLDWPADSLIRRVLAPCAAMLCMHNCTEWNWNWNCEVCWPHRPQPLRLAWKKKRVNQGGMQVHRNAHWSISKDSLWAAPACFWFVGFSGWLHLRHPLTRRSHLRRRFRFARQFPPAAKRHVTRPQESTTAASSSSLCFLSCQRACELAHSQPASSPRLTSHDKLADELPLLAHPLYGNDSHMKGQMPHAGLALFLLSSRVTRLVLLRFNSAAASLLLAS